MNIVGIRKEWMGLALGAAGLMVSGCFSPSGEDSSRDTNQENKLIEKIKDAETTPMRVEMTATPALQPDQAKLEEFLRMRNTRENTFQPPVEGSLEVTPAQAKSAMAPCTINYNSYSALGWIGDHLYAYDSFAYWPHYIGDCPDLNGWAYTVPITYAHYHLGYENAALCYGTIPGKLGVMSGGQCIQTQLDARNYGRRLSPHDNTEFIKIYVNDKNSGARKTFNLQSIHLPLVVPEEPRYGHIKLWIQKANGEWRYWADLTPGTTWNLPQTGVGGAQGIKEIQITSPGQYGWSADDIKIGPYLGG